MIEGFKIPQVTFRIREGDTSDNEIACAIGGKWTNKSTDDFFKHYVNRKSYQELPLTTSDGIVISKSGGSIEETFTVRKISGGIGVERIFPLHSPMINSLKVDRKGKVRRAKLHYLRGLTGKATRITEKR